MKNVREGFFKYKRCFILKSIDLLKSDERKKEEYSTIVKTE